MPLQNNTNNYFENFVLFENLGSILNSDIFKVMPFFENQLFTLIFSFYDNMCDSDVLKLTFEACEKIQHFLNFNYRHNYTIGIGEITNSISAIPYSYKSACNALNYNFYLGNNSIIYINDVEQIEKTNRFKDIDHDKFIFSLKVGDGETAKKILDDVFKSLKKSHQSLELVQRLCLEFIVLTSKILFEAGQNVNQLFNKSGVQALLLQKHQTIDDLHNCLLCAIDLTLAELNYTRKTKNKEIIDKTKQIINCRYNEKLLLSDVAKEVYISPNYLSAIFSKETNTTITDYIIQTRINKARELLVDTDFKIYEVANMVGYENSKHFSILFNKTTGFMPSQYRNKTQIGKAAEDV